jgi:hypothetical protein
MKFSRVWTVSSLLLAGACWSASASASTVVVSISDSISGSVQAVSDGISRSSKSSANAVNNLAEGDYRVVDVAMADGQPGKMRLKLQALATPNDPGVYLVVARAEVEQAGVRDGQLVTASRRPYGMAFTPAHQTAAFAVVLDDQWLKELSAHAVAAS